MADTEAKWYVVHTYSGYENAVATTVEKTAKTRNMTDLILEVNIPTENVVEIVDGEKKESVRKTYPGYVLVKMVMTDDSWHVVRNVRGVTGFVGENNNAISLTEEEIRQMNLEKRDVIVGYEVGSRVRIISGPFADNVGVVDGIEADKSRVRVTLSMFGRETPVDLDFDQVEAEKL